MTNTHPLATEFEAHRKRLRSVAYRILGSPNEADDAVQEAWLRLSRSDVHGIGNLQGWLTTVVARLSLDMLRARKARGEERLEPAIAEGYAVNDAADAVELADSVGIALLVVLESLSPAERVCFVLHDLFNVSFDEIAPIIDRSPGAARQLASRARRRVQGSPAPQRDLERQRHIVKAFMEASRAGNLTALLALLHPDVVMRADSVAVEMNAARREQGAPAITSEIRGAATVVDTFKGRARNAQIATVDGSPGWIFAPNGQLRAVMEFVVDDDRIIEIDLIAAPERIKHLQVITEH